MGVLTVGDLACGRAGDKGSTLDLTLVARDRAAYEALCDRLTGDVVAQRVGAPTATRYEVPGLLALKYVLPGALDAGPWAARRAGVHAQKTTVSALLSMPWQTGAEGRREQHVRTPNGDDDQSLSVAVGHD